MWKLRIIDGFFILVLIGLTYAFYRVIAPFLLDIFLAVILVALFRGMFLFFARKMKPPLASLVTVLILFFCVLALLSFLGIVFSSEAAGGVQDLMDLWPSFKQQLLDLNIEETLKTIPIVEHYLFEDGTFSISRILDRLFSNFSELVIEFVTKSFTSFTYAILHFVFILFILFFLFLDGEKLLDKIRSLIPLDEKHTEELIREIVTVSRATIVTIFTIGIMEGTYGAIIFAVFGIPSPVLWGILIMILSMVPLIGSNVIIVPAGIIQILTGRYLSGIIIILLGIAGIAVTQNIIRPHLQGGRSGMHPMIVLLATFGGIAWLGIVGFLVGPMVASLFVAIWQQFGERFKNQLDER